MITTKQRAVLRGLANTIDPVMQIGKEGLTENSLKQIDGLFEARELFKIKVLKNSDEDVRGLAQKLQKQTGCDIVQCIGNRLVVYRRSNKKNFKHIEI
ncbi:MAG: ribosome assembly RNA-binding protein YhbY [Clostridia bacterium]|nr:ribosome assembly RNA-binding protein YhbY [Clostridia bacterium]